MSEDASPYPLTDSPSGRLGVTYATLALLVPISLLMLGTSGLIVLTKENLFWEGVVLIGAGGALFWILGRRWWNTVVWFEWKDDVLRFRLAGRSTIHSRP